MSAAKVLFVTVLASILLAAHVSAHGHISTSINGDLDVRFTEAGVDKCGISAAEKDAKREAGLNDPLSVTRGEEVAYQFQITNGDGAGPLTVQVDPTCEGVDFPVNIEVTKQVPGAAGIAPDASILPKFFEFRVKFPADLKCKCGPSGNLCLLQVTTPQSFASCAFIAPVDKSRDFNKRTSFQQQNYMFSPNQPQQQQQQQQQQQSFGQMQRPQQQSFGQMQRPQQQSFGQMQRPQQQYSMENGQRMQLGSGYNAMQMRQPASPYGGQQFSNQGGFNYGQSNRFQSAPMSQYRRN